MPVSLLLSPLLVLTLYYLYRREFKAFKRQWKGKVEEVVSSFSQQLRDLDHSSKTSTSKLLQQFLTMDSNCEAEAESCSHAITDIQIAISRLQLECQSEITSKVVDDKTHTIYTIAQHRKKSLKKTSQVGQ